MIKLNIDSREKSPLAELVIKEATKMNIPCEKKWLEIGDYTYHDVCFEAKSSFDFIMSVMNKRLWNQIDNMDRAFNNNVVIIYGEVGDASQRFAVYGRKNDPQGRGVIKEQTKDGRTTHWVPQVQS